MVTASSIAALNLKQRGDHIKRRVDRALETSRYCPMRP